MQARGIENAFCPSFPRRLERADRAVLISNDPIKVMASNKPCRPAVEYSKRLVLDRPNNSLWQVAREQSVGDRCNHVCACKLLRNPDLAIRRESPNYSLPDSSELTVGNGYAGS